MQSFNLLVLVAMILSLGLSVRSTGEFDMFDQSKPIDPGQEDFGEPDDCPLSSDDKQDNDWQMIELSHKDPQFHQIDHLPMIKLIDYSKWQLKNKYLPPSKKHIQSGRKQSEQLLEARKLFLQKKFHHKLRPLNVHHEQFGKKITSGLEPGVYPQQPMVTMFANHETVNKFEDQLNHNTELQQQQDLSSQFERDLDTLIVDSPRVQTMKMLELNYAHNKAGIGNDEITQRSHRARESFQVAAELAKKLNNPTGSGPRRDNNSELINPVDMVNLITSSKADNSIAVGWDPETTGNVSSVVPVVDNIQGSPKYLGFGQLYKTDDLRSSSQQARLSCSFGFSDMESDSNQNYITPAEATVSVSTNSLSSLSCQRSLAYTDGVLSIDRKRKRQRKDVKWAKFVGNYDPDQVEPTFECKSRTCRVVEVKNDIWTTIHPRPAIQHYSSNQTLPSYSLTIHQVNPERNIGVYRCSAVRRIGDKKQLVYRVIPFIV